MLLIVLGAALVAVPALDPGVPPAFQIASRPPAKVTLSSGGVEVPLEAGRLPVVAVTIDGQGPFRFGIETGSPCAVISPALAERLGLPDAGGDEQMRARRIARLEVGGASFQGVLAPAFGVTAPDVDGVLGLSVFSDVLLTVDGVARKVRVERGALPAPDGKAVLPILRQGPFVGVSVRFGRHHAIAVVDTRASSDLLVLPGMVKDLELASAPVEIGRARGPAIPETVVKAARLDGDVTFGEVVVERPIVNVHDVPPPIPQRPLIGNGVLSRLAFTLDQRNERIRFRAPGPIPAPPPLRTLGFGLRPPARAGELPLVGAMVPGSPADRAGVQVGDLVVALGGIPGPAIDPARLRELTREGKPVEVRLSRQGTEIAVAVEPVTLVP